MNGFEIAILCLLLLGLVLESYLHGQPRTGKYSAPMKILTTALSFWLYYKAGLFQIFG